MPSAYDWIALPVILLAALMAAVIARGTRADSWPRSLWVVPVALAAWAVMVHEGMVGNYARWLSFDPTPSNVVPLAVAAMTIVAILVVLRRRGAPALTAAWVGASGAFIAVVSLTVGPFDPPLTVHGADALVACVQGADRWLPGSLSDMFTDVLPNAALFAPLGYGLAALGWRMPRIIAAAALTSLAVELYQALLTTRVCSPRDLATNMVGSLIGAGVLALIWRDTQSEPASSPSARQAPVPRKPRPL